MEIFATSSEEALLVASHWSPPIASKWFVPYGVKVAGDRGSFSMDRTRDLIVFLV
jgi:hypothetical protein